MAEVLPFRVASAFVPDALERERALDVRASWIVEAPAGSGKTGLLIQRYLKLLADASVQEPEQVLAITFTLKATAEMKERIVEQLESAAADGAVKDAFERHTRELAEAVLRRDEVAGWGLLFRPQRLNIRTIDSVCSEIARALPVLSGTGGRLAPVNAPEQLYRQAAQRTMMQLGGEDRALHQALETLLLHRDGNLGDCERLLMEMLGQREQWGRLIPLDQEELDEAYLDGTVLPQLERALEVAICQALTELSDSAPADLLRELTATAAEFAYLDGYKGAESPIALCANRNEPPGERAEHLAHWRALVHLLVTPSTGTWRKSFNVNHVGFAADKTHKARLVRMIERLQERDDLLQAMCRLGKLPPTAYPREQWVVAKALFRVLSRALAELRIVFAERGECDFPELGLAAREALGGGDGVEDLAAALGMETKHLLVDEMQDTSSGQYDLIEQLTHGWDGRSQTVFLVGDPKQSIYRFRQARVERFVQTMKDERLGEVAVGRLRLSSNFRSQAMLVEQLNESFSRLFPDAASPVHPEEVPYAKALAVRAASSAAGLVWHTDTVKVADRTEETTLRRSRQARSEAREVRGIAMDWLARPLPPGRTAPWRIAVLVRAKTHLARIVAELKRDGREGVVPFRAVEIDALGERQEVLDLLGLTRALLHPADRVAWFAVLHAPWCGLGLADLHVLAGADDRELRERCVLDLMGERGHLLSEEGEARLARVWPVLVRAAAERGRSTLAHLVERTWRSLGGDAYLGVAETANAMRFMRLLDELEADGGEVDTARLKERMKNLYADSDLDPEAIELITIHKAKGLEWDVVVVPALERRAKSDGGRLMEWIEVDSGEEGAAHVVLAPIAGRGKDSSELREWIRSVDATREAAERKRLLYVASTRAREELHLFAAPDRNAKGEVCAASGSLLKAAWPVAQHLFDGEAAGFAPVEDLAEDDYLGAIAAGEDSIQKAEGRPPMLSRLPLGFDPMERFTKADSLATAKVAGDPVSLPQVDRPEGSLAARAFGNAVHVFLEMMAEKVASGMSHAALATELSQWMGRASALLRGDGLAPAVVERLARRVIDTLQTTLGDPHGRWILASHAGAANEVARTAWNQDRDAVRTSVRLDRIFRAGATPGEDGQDFLWIVDYKTAIHGSDGLDDFMAQERRKYQPQLAAYAETMAGMWEARTAPPAGMRVALYYPGLSRLEWWDPDPMWA